MFVAELDRPWLDTPFLLQGFAIDGTAQLEALRRHCRTVIVDPSASTAAARERLEELVDSGQAAPRSGTAVDAEEAARLLQDAHDHDVGAGNRVDGTSVAKRTQVRLRGHGGAPADTGPAHGRARPIAPDSPVAPRRQPPSDGPIDRATRERFGRFAPAQKRADVHISDETRQRFRSLVRDGARAEAAAAAAPADALAEPRPGRGWIARWLALFRRRPAQRPPASRAATALQAIRSELPSAVVITEYEDRTELVEELPRARAALALGETVLGHVVSDVESGRVPDIAMVADVSDALVASITENRDALLLVGRLRAERAGTYQHSVRVALYLIALGRQIGFPHEELVQLGTLGMLADVGKLRLPRALLEKPGMLTPSEFEQVKQHVKLGLDTIAAAGSLPAAVEQGIAQHHERIDGTGYPAGLSGMQISLYGRMAAIADSFSALIAERDYADARSPQDALLSLYQWAGTSFHEPLVEQFVQAIGVFPVGSLVELSNQEVAIVIEINRARRLEPRVLVLAGRDKAALPEPFERNLLTQSQAGPDRLRITRGLPVGAYGLELRDYFLDRTLAAAVHGA
jgi:HD-GYP domain-containing protein (c-di-GMP phosphodiesterase class II)